MDLKKSVMGTIKSLQYWGVYELNGDAIVAEKESFFDGIYKLTQKSNKKTRIFSCSNELDSIIRS